MSESWQRDRHQSTALELGGGRVIIVDDDPQVCVYVALVLKIADLEKAIRDALKGEDQR